MIEGSCHCGAVVFRITNPPQWLTECNCTLCRRVGALWAHVDISEVEIISDAGATTSYIQGDKTLATHTCNTCGCTTHWENLTPGTASHMAVNFRMCSPVDVSRLPIRKFDGFDTWRYLNDE
jgi:hypothetical protein